METIASFYAQLAAESSDAYESSPFSALSKDYCSRFWRDLDVTPLHSIADQPDEVEINATWTLMLSTGAPEVCRLMTEKLRGFLQHNMATPIEIEPYAKDHSTAITKAVVLLTEAGGEAGCAESFTIDVQPERVLVAGADANGLRDGIVKLIDLMGMRRAPLIALGRITYRPRLAVRLGSVPWLGDMSDAVCFGYNACLLSGSEFYKLSTSAAIPELIEFRQPQSLEKLARESQEAKRYGLKTYLICTTPKFERDAPVFVAHPELRGALTWKEDGLHVLCTEHPLAQQYLAETTAGIYRSAPDLDGIVVIIGGEGFYHCFMRPYGADKGHTNCPRCEVLGPETVVSSLLNRMGAAARTVNPKAEIVAWPYSAIHVWSEDTAEVPFIENLQPGVALFTEMEKDADVTTPEGIQKHLWDYSTHLSGPVERTQRQIEAAQRVGIPVYVKSEPELSFEAPRLPHVPCLDLWLERASAMASCGAAGAWVFPAFRPMYGTSAAEVYKHLWWEPAPTPEGVLQQLAARIAGAHGGPLLRQAWRLVSQALPHAPELPPYYTGPYYLGPAHPMCADPRAELPKVFFGRYLFWAEIKPEEGLKLQPTFLTQPRGDVPLFLTAYRRMEALLSEANAQIELAVPLVPAAARMPFEAEASAIRWFYRTVRTHANFYESCRIRDCFFPSNSAPVAKDTEENKQALLAQWREVLVNELDNTRAALPLMEADMRLDFYYGGDHSFSHGADMLRAKLQLLDIEINEFLPSI